MCAAGICFLKQRVDCRSALVLFFDGRKGRKVLGARRNLGKRDPGTSKREKYHQEM